MVAYDDGRLAAGTRKITRAECTPPQHGRAKDVEVVIGYQGGENMSAAKRPAGGHCLHLVRREVRHAGCFATDALEIRV